MEVSEVQLFQILKERIGEEEARSLAEYVEAKIEKQFDLKKDVLATKQDIAELKIEIANVRNELKLEIADLRTELKTDLANLRTELKTDIANLRTELKTDIANSRSDVIKWMFIFLFGQLAAIYAIVEYILKK
ncbi:hypothetical protein [Mucilaginibacter arboris]|uniref:DUF1640 domain-containing protein n=1 Tax=Mucilaginibacter arboris TaxID=2682090 RepID=A0A7K1SUU8_9SPHI|nr:hypothetical protein [Mucilaginibacter arboris]MVN21106.1 hypothetical protein [Mucilaginibacter arboris]